MTRDEYYVNVVRAVVSTHQGCYKTLYPAIANAVLNAPPYVDEELELARRLHWALWENLDLLDEGEADINEWRKVARVAQECLGGRGVQGPR